MSRTGTNESVRGLDELLARLVGVEGGQVVVIAVVPAAERRAPSSRLGPRAVPHATGSPCPTTSAHPTTNAHPTGSPCPTTSPHPTTKERRPDGNGWERLTDRERTVARLAGYALTNQQIANRLRISPHTVNFHLRQVFRKLGIDSRVSLARIVEAHPPLVDPSARGGPTERA